MASLFEVNDGEVFPASDIRLRLALQNLYVVGNSLNQDFAELHQLHLNADDGFCGVAAGREFMLMTASSGKVFYQGKASALGLKTVPGESNDAGPIRWNELPFPKGPSIARCAVGHDGQHAVLIDTNGTAYFVGLARRGEDGDLSMLLIIITFT